MVSFLVVASLLTLIHLIGLFILIPTLLVKEEKEIDYNELRKYEIKEDKQFEKKEKKF